LGRHRHEVFPLGPERISGTCPIEPDRGIITDCALTKASRTAADGQPVSEASVGLDLLDGEDAPVTVLAEWTYGSRQFGPSPASADTLIGSSPAPTRAAIPSGFTVDDFTVDRAAGTATCPTGVTKKISPRAGCATFGTACTDCPLRARCTRSATGKSLKIRPHDALQRARPPRRLRPGLAGRIPTSPAHGRTLHRLARPRHRKLRYRGVAKNDHWLHHRAVAINLRRLITLGLNHDATAWALS
jgi:hypothetical protein